MSATVLVVPAREFDGWLAREGAAQAAGRSNLGREQWVGVCMKCHRLNEEYVGPPLAGNPILKDEQGLNRLVRNGFGAMPAVGQEWTNREVQALYDFTRRLPGGGAAGGGQG
jgi:cytochrome c5